MEWTGVCDASSHMDSPLVLASSFITLLSPVFLLKSVLGFPSDTLVSLEKLLSADSPVASCHLCPPSAALNLTPELGIKHGSSAIMLASQQMTSSPLVRACG